MSTYILTYGGRPITRNQGQYNFISTDWIDWVPMTWQYNRIPTYGNNVWNEGDDSTAYYSQANYSYNYALYLPVSGTTGAWSNTSWTNLTRFDGKHVWNGVDGNTYFSNADNGEFSYYILDTSGSRWNKKNWSVSLWGEYIWSIGGINYCSTDFYYNESTGKWGIANWQRDTPMYTSNPLGNQIWKDNSGHVYYSNVALDSSSEQYEIVRAESGQTPSGTWYSKTWKGLTKFYGEDVWHHPNGMIFYSRGTQQYVLDEATSTWSPMTWKGLTSYYGRHVWTYKGRVYYSNGNDNQYVLTW